MLGSTAESGVTSRLQPSHGQIVNMQTAGHLHVTMQMRMHDCLLLTVILAEVPSPVLRLQLSW